MKITDKHTASLNVFIQFLSIFWPPIVVFFLHVFLVRVVNIYTFYPWLDTPMHYLGGLSIAFSLFTAVSVLQSRRAIHRLDFLVELVLVFSLVATIAVFWEFAEFLLDQFLGTDLQVSLPNTMKDLLMGILGVGTLVACKIIQDRQSRLATK